LKKVSEDHIFSEHSNFQQTLFCQTRLQPINEEKSINHKIQRCFGEGQDILFLVHYQPFFLGSFDRFLNQRKKFGPWD